MKHMDTMQSTRRTEENEVCRQVRQDLPLELLGELDENSSSTFFQHVCQCRGCLGAYIALQTAADMAARRC